MEVLSPISRRIDSLRADPANARRHGRRNVDAIAASLQRFGQQKLVVVDADGVVVAGNATLEAAKRLGWETIDVVVTGLSKVEAAAYAIADNRTAELGEWDDEALMRQLRAIEAEDPAMLYDAGWTLDELQRMGDAALREGLTDPDSIPEPPDEATTRRGDVWILGDHRLMCGDSSSPADVDQLIAGERIHLVNTDPPYNVNVSPRSHNAIAAGNSTAPATGKATHRKLRAKDRPLANDFVSPAEFDRLLAAWFGNAARVLEPGRGFYIWGGYTNFVNYPRALDAAGLYFSQAVIWVKEHPVLTRKDMMGNHEWCFYGWRQGAAHTWLGPRNVPDVWTPVASVERGGERRVLIEVSEEHLAHCATDVWRVKKLHSSRTVHLTEKPVTLAIRAMQYSSRPGENVLDLFGGSGSTLVAAEQCGRRARLMELDPPYCDVIVRRWEEFTGRKAERPAGA